MNPLKFFGNGKEEVDFKSNFSVVMTHCSLSGQKKVASGVLGGSTCSYSAVSALEV